jgi:predicted dehydrogenase
MSLRVGIAGYGIVGKTRHRVLSQHQVFNVVAVSDINFKENPAEIDNVNTYYDYKDLIDKEDLDVLFVSLPNKLASEATLIGLKHGLHIFCEKPPAKTLEELYPIRDFLNENKDLKLMYGFNHRFHASIIDAINIIKDGSLGKVVNLRGVYGKSNMISFNQTDWRTKRSESGGGILLDQGIHMLDLMRYFAGDFTSVHAFISNSFWNFDVEDNAYVMMKSDSGIVAQLMSSATQWQHTFNLNITLEKGSLVLGGLRTSSKSYGEETLRIISSDAEKLNTKPQVEERGYDEDISWDEEIKCFAGVLLNSDNIENGSIDEALKIMELIETIYKADPEWRAKYYNESR